MNDKFYQLPNEKQQRIINAGLEFFGRYDYKKASTEDIACKAEISKGLLFYYFHNKKEYYQFLYDYTFKTITKQVVDNKYKEITDFFELLKYCADKKYELMKINPYIYDFSMKYYYNSSQEVSQENNSKINNFYDTVIDTYLSNIDFSKFRNDIDPKEIFNMLYYTADGLIMSRLRMNNVINTDLLMTEFTKICELYKRISYKEEYQ